MPKSRKRKKHYQPNKPNPPSNKPAQQMRPGAGLLQYTKFLAATCAQRAETAEGRAKAEFMEAAERLEKTAAQAATLSAMCNPAMAAIAAAAGAEAAPDSKAQANGPARPSSSANGSSDKSKRSASDAGGPEPEPAATAGPFTPSAAQLRFFAALRDPELVNGNFPNLRQILAQAGIPRSTFYRWLQCEAFRYWLSRKALDHLVSMQPYAMLILNGLAFERNEQSLLRFICGAAMPSHPAMQARRAAARAACSPNATPPPSTEEELRLEAEELAEEVTRLHANLQAQQDAGQRPAESEEAPEERATESSLREEIAGGGPRNSAGRSPRAGEEPSLGGFTVSLENVPATNGSGRPEGDEAVPPQPVPEAGEKGPVQAQATSGESISAEGASACVSEANTGSLDIPGAPAEAGEAVSSARDGVAAALSQAAESPVAARASGA